MSSQLTSNLAAIYSNSRATISTATYVVPSLQHRMSAPPMPVMASMPPASSALLLSHSEQVDLIRSCVNAVPGSAGPTPSATGAPVVDSVRLQAQLDNLHRALSLHASATTSESSASGLAGHQPIYSDQAAKSKEYS